MVCFMNQKKPADILLQEDLERRIVHGIACEWENALWVLSSHDRQQMKQPLFGLGTTKSRLGFWSGLKNEITISRTFALNYPWDDVRDVLYHEMAHQYTDQVLKSSDKTPHGPDFLLACHRLRANPKASGRYQPLHDQIHHRTISNQDRILMRVKKLMSLAKSTNRHEAEAAMAKAHALMRKYNIDLMNKSSHRNFVSMFIGVPALRHHREEYHLANLLQNYYFIQGLWVSSYVLPKGKMGRVFEVSGIPENVKIASYVYDFVKNTIDMHWRRYNQKKTLNRYRKTDFAVGVVEGFCNKLESQKPAPLHRDKTTALVTLEDPMLAAYMSHKYPRTKTFQRSASSQDDQVLKHGYDIGKDLVISKGIESKKNSQRRFIE
jgi:Protein of unknown function (DUF2786)/SprT-like family